MTEKDDSVIDVDVIAEGTLEAKAMPPVFLVIADEGEEFEKTLDYALKLAMVNEGRVGLFHAISDEEFQHWAGIEDQLYQELREQAEKFTYKAAKHVETVTGKKPSLYLPKGDLKDKIVETVLDDKNIAMLVLGASAASTASALMGKISVPVVLVPEKIDLDLVKDIKVESE